MSKRILTLVLLLISFSGFPVCTTPILRTDIGYKSILSSARYNSELNTAFNRSNNLPGDCIVSESITASKLAPGAITTSKIADGAITSSKIASGAIPAVGRLLRVRSFTSSGTWTKLTDTGLIMIQVQGGGGASYHASSTAGGNSSFGTHCTAYGGAKPVAGSCSTVGIGGGAAGGDINLQGGDANACSGTSSGYFGSGGLSMMGQYGAGGIGSFNTQGGGGGAGGYCAKIIQRDSLNATEAVTIGAGGTNPGTGAQPGKSGIVFVYEYSL